MALYGSNFWKKSPFIKLLLAMIAGIVVQWHFQIDIATWWIVLSVAIAVILSFFIIPFFNRYRFALTKHVPRL